MVESEASKNTAGKQVASLQKRHLTIGWLGLLLFLSLGIVLEMLHGLKLGFYLDVHNSSRRFMWTLAHTHGTLFALVHIAFACSLGFLRITSAGSLKLISKCLTGGLIIMPLGFFSGGFWMYGGDPGMGVFLVPVGALLLLCGVGMFCLLMRKENREGNQPAAGSQKTREQQGGKSRNKRRRK